MVEVDALQRVVHGIVDNAGIYRAVQLEVGIPFGAKHCV